jgi:hypothetical protein
MALRRLGFEELINAIYDRIDTDVLTSAYRVYGHVPDDATLPYVVVGSPMGTRSASLGATDIEGQDNIIHIHVWSDYYGEKEVTEMMDNIVQAIHGTTLTITGYTPVLPLYEYSDVILDETESARPIRHGVIRWRIHMA